MGGKDDGPNRQYTDNLPPVFRPLNNVCGLSDAGIKSGQMPDNRPPEYGMQMRRITMGQVGLIWLRKCLRCLYLIRRAFHKSSYARTR